MALIGDTGNGATLTCATSSLSLAITQLQIGEQSIDMLDVSTLATTSDQEMVASDLKKTQEVTGTAIYVGSATLPVVGAVAETMTITFPLFAGTTTAANLAGTAQFTSSKLPDISNGNIMMYQFKFKYNGDTGPTYTKAT